VAGPRLNDRKLRRGFAALLIGSALLSGMEAVRRQTASAQRAAPISFRSAPLSLRSMP